MTTAAEQGAAALCSAIAGDDSLLLETAITLLRTAVTELPQVSAVASLGPALRYGWHGRSGDLDEAIELLRAAVEATRPGHPAAAGRLGTLGVALDDRHERTGADVDLDHSCRGTDPGARSDGPRAGASPSGRCRGPAGAYLSAHGANRVWSQAIAFRDGSTTLSAASVLRHPWPTWVIFASCLVGRVELNAGDEPLGLPGSCSSAVPIPLWAMSSKSATPPVGSWPSRAADAGRRPSGSGFLPHGGKVRSVTPLPEWLKTIDPSLRTDAVNALCDVRHWHLSAARWSTAEQAIRLISASLRSRDSGALRVAVIALELAGPVRAAEFGSPPMIPAKDPVIEEVNEMIDTLDGRKAPAADD